MSGCPRRRRRSATAPSSTARARAVRMSNAVDVREQHRGEHGLRRHPRHRRLRHAAREDPQQHLPVRLEPRPARMTAPAPRAAGSRWEATRPRCWRGTCSSTSTTSRCAPSANPGEVVLTGNAFFRNWATFRATQGTPPPTVDEKSMHLLADLPFKKQEGNIVADGGFDLDPALYASWFARTSKQTSRFTVEEWSRSRRRRRARSRRRPGWARRSTGGRPRSCFRRTPR